MEQLISTRATAEPASSDESAILGQWFGFEQPTPTKLPPIHPGDRALLYSLLLHDGLRLQHIALSLGASESALLPRLRELLRLGIVRRQGRTFLVEPQYYPALKSDLARNNFLVGDS